MMGKRERNTASDWTSGLSQARHVQTILWYLAASQKTLEPMVLFGHHRMVQRNRRRDRPFNNKLDFNTQVTRPMVASGGRKGGMDRRIDFRRDLRDAEREFSTIGATPHEHAGSGTKCFAVRSWPSIRGWRRWQQLCGEAPAWLPTTDSMGSEICCRHCKVEESRRNNLSAMVDRKTKGHMTMSRYEMDPNKERTKAVTKMGRPHGKGRNRHAVIKSPRNKRPTMVYTCTENAQIKLGQNTSRKILMLRGRWMAQKKHNSKNTKTENQATQRTIQGGYTWHNTG